MCVSMCICIVVYLQQVGGQEQTKKPAIKFEKYSNSTIFMSIWKANIKKNVLSRNSACPPEACSYLTKGKTFCVTWWWLSHFVDLLLLQALHSHIKRGEGDIDVKLAVRFVKKRAKFSPSSLSWLKLKYKCLRNIGWTLPHRGNLTVLLK